MLGNTEGKRIRGQQRMRWFDSITDSMDVNLSKLWERVKDRGAWRDAVNGVTKSQMQLNDWRKTNWEIKVYIFNVCSVMIWYSLLNDHPIKLIIISHSYHFCVCVVRTQQSLGNFQVYSTLLLTTATLLYRSPELIHLITGSVYPRTTISHFPPGPPPTPWQSPFHSFIFRFHIWVRSYSICKLWLILLSISFRFFRVIINSRISLFSLLNSIPSSVSRFHSSADRHLGCLVSWLL